MAVSQPTLPPLPIQDGVRFAHIPGLWGYAATDDGRVFSCLFGSHIKHWRELAQFAKRSGHLRVSVRKNRSTLYVHRAVLLAFVGPCPEGMEACHFPDRNPKNNRVENLRWDTRKGNAFDRYAHGTVLCGRKSSQAKLTDSDVRWIRERVAAGESVCKLGREFGVSHAVISRIARRIDWAHV